MTEHDFGPDHFCVRCHAWSFGQQADRECVSVPAVDPVRADDAADVADINYSEITRGFA